MRIVANLDCEARWAGVALPARVLGRISMYASLLAAFADRDAPCAIWAPAAVDHARLVEHPGWRAPVMHVGAPPDADLAWADDDALARDANDRARGLAIAQALGVALPGARLIASLAELDAHLAAGGAAASATRRWVAKARWTAAGRDRVHGVGDTLAGESRAHAARLIDQHAARLRVAARPGITGAFDRLGAVVFEPWVERVLDVGVCVQIAGDARVTLHAPHGLVCDERGGFTGISLATPALTATERAQLETIATAAATAIAARGYRGALGIDAFVYRDATGDRRLHPLCELNARYTFGFVARALAARLGIEELGFAAPPAGALVLIAPGPDRVTAWCR